MTTASAGRTSRLRERFRWHDDRQLFAFDEPPAFESVTARVALSDGRAIERLTSGPVDATMTNLGLEIGGSVADDLDRERVAHQPNAFYHLVFNTCRRPLRNPNVQRLIARLIGNTALADAVFGGYGVPSASPRAGTDWLADPFRWDNKTGFSPEVALLGTDGEQWVEQARELVRSLGYQVTANNKLIT